MQKLECIIFNVEHGFCSFIKSPNNYGLLIDCGSRPYFSPVKWVKGHYNIGNSNIQYYDMRRIAEAIITHLHLDHFDDVGSLEDTEKPKNLLRDKQTLRFIDKKIEKEKDERTKVILKSFKKFQEDYNKDIDDKIEWGFDFYEHSQISYDDAEEISSSDDKIINNRSFIVGIGFAGKKILIPGDIEVEGWKKAFGYDTIKKILKGTNFFVASHHGHKSGFTSEIIEYTGKPDIFIVSAKSGDEHVDSSYSKKEYSNGFLIQGDQEKSRMVSTRELKNSIKIVIQENGDASISIIDTPDNLNENQVKILERRKKQILKKLGY